MGHELHRLTRRSAGVFGNRFLVCSVTILLASSVSLAQPTLTTNPTLTRATILSAMKRATAFMVEKVAVHGGYVWSYAPDLSRRWGEMEAYPTMAWIQSPGTPAMGHLFLDAYHATKDEFYYQAACKTADGLVEGQLSCGGWNYFIDFAGEASAKKWFDTIGKNGWRLEEFQHYYGNATFDDDTTIDASRFMLRIYLEKKDPKYKASLDKAIQFVLDSQYPNGGWPQRFPLMGGFSKGGLPDYTGFITFNDDVVAGNIEFLLQCYRLLGDKRVLDPIQRGMNIFVLCQQPAPQAGWGLQHTPDDLKAASARTYEPKAVVTHTTGTNIEHMIRYYYWTGDKKFLARLPEALDWLDSVKLAPNTPGARPGSTHPTFIEVGTNKGLFVHRTGSNVINGHYFADYNPENTIGHYSSFRTVNTEGLREQYKQALATPPEQAVKDSPLRADATPVDLVREFAARGGGGRGGRGFGGGSPQDRAAQLIASLNADGYWPTRLTSTSHPYKGDGPMTIAPGDFVRTQVGDEFDTSPFGGGFGGGDQANAVMGITTQSYMGNMRALIGYLNSAPQ